MLGIDARAFRVAWTVFLVAGLVVLLYRVREALLVFVLALLFAHVIWPLVQSLEALWQRALPSSRNCRLWALSVVYAVLVGVAAVGGTVLAPQVADQAATLFQRATAFASDIQQGRLLVEMSEERGWSLPVLFAIRDQLLRHAGGILPYLRTAGLEVLHYLSNIWLFVLAPILAFFFLKDSEKLVGAIQSWFAHEGHRDFLRGLFNDIHRLLAQYMRALIVLSLLTFLSHALFFFVARVPYALLLATLAGILEFIPFAGPVSAAILIVLASWMAGYPHLLWILVFLAVWRLIQDYVNMPLVFGSGVELHPLLVIFGILAGAQLAGVAGMFLSIPAMAAARILVRRTLAQPGAAP